MDSGSVGVNGESCECLAGRGLRVGIGTSENEEPKRKNIGFHECLGVEAQ